MTITRRAIFAAPLALATLGPSPIERLYHRFEVSRRELDALAADGPDFERLYDRCTRIEARIMAAPSADMRDLACKIKIAARYDFALDVGNASLRADAARILA